MLQKPGLCNPAGLSGNLLPERTCLEPATPPPRPPNGVHAGLWKGCSANSTATLHGSCLPRRAKPSPRRARHQHSACQRKQNASHSTPDAGRKWLRPVAAESGSATPRRNYNSQYRSNPDSRKPILGRPEAAETQPTGLRLIQPGKGAGRAVGRLSVRHYERGFCSEAVYFQNDRGQRARHEGTSHG